MKYQTTVNGHTFEIEITRDGDLFVNGEQRHVDFISLRETLHSLIMDTESHQVLVDGIETHDYEVIISGRQYNVNVLDERALLLGSRRGGAMSDSGEISIKSPMPGLVVDIPVAEGDTIEKGQTVVILESMKMQNELKAPREGTVQRISVTPGQSVEQNKVLVTIT